MRQLAAVLLLAALPFHGVAQEPDPLASVFEGGTLEALQVEIRGARAEGLPVEPIVLKALEGHSKGATDAMILDAVAGLRSRLRRAVALVGPDASSPLLVAAAGALYVGVEPERVREMHMRMEAEAVGMALVVLGDLVRRGVPVADASRTILSIGVAGLDAAGFARFRERVDADIRGGLAPLHATEARARGVLARLGGG